MTAIRHSSSAPRPWSVDNKSGCLPFRKAIEELCDESGSSCPSCNFSPLNKPTGYIKHILSCTNANGHVSDEQHAKLVAVCFYTCTKKGYNASPRPTRPSFDEFSAVEKIHALQRLSTSVLEELWSGCERWTVPSQLSDLLPEAFMRRDASALLNGWPVMQAVEHAAPPLATTTGALPVAERESLVSTLTDHISEAKPAYLSSGEIVLKHLDTVLSPEQSLTYEDFRTLLRLSSTSLPSVLVPETVNGRSPSPVLDLKPSSPVAASEAKSLPSSAALSYTSAFPQGPDPPQFSSIQTTAHLCLAINRAYPHLPTAQLPTSFQEALAKPLKSTDWVPEAVLMTQLALVFDELKGDHAAYMDFSYKISYDAIATALGSRVQTENTYDLLREGPMWWQIFKRGTHLEVIEKGPGRALFGLRHPEQLYMPFMVEGFAESIKAFLDLQGLPTTTRPKVESSTECHFESLWPEP